MEVGATKKRPSFKYLCDLASGNLNPHPENRRVRHPTGRPDQKAQSGETQGASVGFWWEVLGECPDGGGDGPGDEESGPGKACLWGGENRRKPNEKRKQR